MDTTSNILKREVTFPRRGGKRSKKDPMIRSYHANPLEIAGVLHCLFKFLPLQEIKRCRLVSKDWNYAAEPFLRHLSRISFGIESRCSDTNRNRTLSDFRDTFRNSGTEIPFSAFGLKTFKCSSSHWTETSIIEILEGIGSTATDLKMDNVCINHLSIGRPYDLSKSFSTMYLTVLYIEPCLSHVSFALNTITNVKHLYLRNCSLRLLYGIRILPVEISIKNCTLFFPEGNNVHVLNDFIDFDKMKQCTIHSNAGNRGIGEKLCLDVSGNKELHTMEIYYINVLNWELSHWKVNNCILGHIDQQLGKSMIKIKHLELECCQVSSLGIPESVETLTLKTISNWTPISVSLPKLRHLKLFSPPSHLSIQSPNLVSLEIFTHDCVNGVGEINLSSIAASVKKLKITADKVTCIGETSAQLEILVLDGIFLPSLLSILSNIQTQNVVCYFGSSNTQRGFKNNQEALKFLRCPYKTIAIGPFSWNNLSKRPCRLEEFVHERSEFYVFSQGKASAIELDHFRKLMSI